MTRHARAPLAAQLQPRPNPKRAPAPRRPAAVVAAPSLAYSDPSQLVLNKPSGVAIQGVHGSAQRSAWDSLLAGKFRHSLSPQTQLTVRTPLRPARNVRQTGRPPRTQARQIHYRLPPRRPHQASRSQALATTPAGADRSRIPRRRARPTQTRVQGHGQPPTQGRRRSRAQSLAGRLRRRHSRRVDQVGMPRDGREFLPSLGEG